MQIQINKKIIKSLKPCLDRYENYLRHYVDFDGSIEEFLDLDEITHQDKLWVTLRLMPRFLIEVFAIDCAVSAAAYAAAYAAADAAADAAAAAADVTAAYAAAAADVTAAYAAAYAAAAAADVTAAYAAAYAAAAYAEEQQRQIETLIYLIQNHREE